MKGALGLTLVIIGGFLLFEVLRSLPQLQGLNFSFLTNAQQLGTPAVAGNVLGSSNKCGGKGKLANGFNCAECTFINAAKCTAYQLGSAVGGVLPKALLDDCNNCGSCGNLNNCQ